MSGTLRRSRSRPTPTSSASACGTGWRRPTLSASERCLSFWLTGLLSRTALLRSVTSSPTSPEGEREPFCRLRTDYLEALLAPEPGGRVRSLLRRARCNQPHRAPGSDARLHHRAGACLGGRSQRGQAGQALGRSRGGFSTKIHLKVDLDGLPLAFHLTEGQASDSPQFGVLLDLGPDITPRAAVGDKGYDSKAN